MRAAAQTLGIPESSIRSWYRPGQRDGLPGKPVIRGKNSLTALTQRERHALAGTMPPAETVDKAKAELGDIFDRIVQNYFGALADLSPEELADLVRNRPKDFAWVGAVVFDKTQLLEGKPTSINQTQYTYMKKGALKEYVQQLEVIEGGKSAAESA